MTVKELMRFLEGLDEGTEVRFASQSDRPMEYGIDPYAYAITDVGQRETLYLVESNQIGHLPPEAKEQIGW